MADGLHDAAGHQRYAQAQARLEHRGGYAWRERTAGVIRGLGFSEVDLDRLLDTFSERRVHARFTRPRPGRDPDLRAPGRADQSLGLQRKSSSSSANSSHSTPPSSSSRTTVGSSRRSRTACSSPAGRGSTSKGRGTIGGSRRAHGHSTPRRPDLARRGHRLARAPRRAVRYKRAKGKQAQKWLTHIGRPEMERGGSGATLENAYTWLPHARLDFPARRSGRMVVEAEAEDSPCASCPKASRRGSSAKSTWRRLVARTAREDVAGDHARPP